ncbi:hypothetical protein A3Q34_00320 [Colwellia sp. PAMC 20917]|jgi:uncharacterized protein YeaC (DUF1315 family)|uniref:YeaC family protein n=1 Tax=unclassified Colwellia TaxID=196834 RepID=UPI0008790EDB|nr:MULTISPECIES: DUF1315 family protein [unclassified Colwellia]AOW75457.1 hypothetical protein A3Q34_00320 [Colwellia sp. PAMC 20917]MBA6252416.1 DUF1315 family protein [Colwellia sp. MB3u-55]MBA6346531.1 DUF1315 family protein [Colwellia sp. BRX8-9]MBA6353364.1 DUF1315 family protein [Colwellia sp. BRX9-1]MBA6355724.1 DUF1315 family protein [Colwellia sp. BRX8-3]
MDIISLVDDMSEEMYLRLKCAAETGKWPEGTIVDTAQKTSALQITMAYQSRHLNSDQILSVGADGLIVDKTKRQLKSEFADLKNNPDNNIARFSDL